IWKEAPMSDKDDRRPDRGGDDDLRPDCRDEEDRGLDHEDKDNRYPEHEDEDEDDDDDDDDWEIEVVNLSDDPWEGIVNAAKKSYNLEAFFFQNC
ncbi:MAG: hypothetical protein LBO05_01020, partial [Deltaproteobacteria bacterium]|nr:hypothetical protein [Deltaproteobacteria bacterium]